MNDKGRYHMLVGLRRHQQVEHAILTLLLRYSDHLGYSNTLPGLASILRQTFSDTDNRETVDTLKRLRPQYLTLWKWNDEHRRFIEYPAKSYSVITILTSS